MSFFDFLDVETKVKQEYPWWVEAAAIQGLRNQALQFENIRNQSRFQEEMFGRLPGEIRAETEARQSLQEGAAPLLDTTRDLVQQQAEAAAKGTAATPEQQALIRQQAEQAIAAGESDIQRFLQTTGETLREELSPQLGLRPGDSPILDRGQRAREEAVRQQAQLVRSVRGQQARQELEFPLQAAQVETGMRTAGASMSEAARQFQQQLAQQAFQNRLALTGQVGTQGLQLGSLGGNVPIVSAGSQTDVSDPLGQITGVAGGVGGLLTGVGAMGRG